MTTSYLVLSKEKLRLDETDNIVLETKWKVWNQEYKQRTNKWSTCTKYTFNV